MFRSGFWGKLHCAYQLFNRLFAVWITIGLREKLEIELEPLPHVCRHLTENTELFIRKPVLVQCIVVLLLVKVVRTPKDLSPALLKVTSGGIRFFVGLQVKVNVI